MYNLISGKEREWQYNWQHIVFVSNKRKRVFKNEKMQKIVTEAFREVETQYKIRIKKFAFGDDFSHIHMEVNVQCLEIGRHLLERRR